MSFDHAGRVALVTGAGGGIGRATCLRLAAEGALIAAADLDAKAAGQTVDAVTAVGGDAMALPMDVRDRSSVEGAVGLCAEAYGRLDFLVNSAGVITMDSLEQLSDAAWDLVVDVNLKGTWLVTQICADLLASSDAAAVVNLSSVEGRVVVSSSGSCQVHYNAAKGGVTNLTRALAVELGRSGIRVNAVAPGPVATDFVFYEAITSPEAMTFMSQRLVIPRVGQPADVAAAVSFLCSADASWITGTELAVDGGWLTR